jgi:glycosyltransferase involved in cell wall biosynthesis
MYFIIELLRHLPKRRRPPVVFELHDEMKVRYKQRFFDIIDGVVCITGVLEDYVHETYDVSPERTFVSPDGVDPSRYTDITKSEARESFDIPEREPVVMYTGHLYPGKGAKILAHAAPEIDAEVYIVGGYPEDVERVRSSVPATENLTFTGFVDPADIPRYQTAADVLVAPYTRDARRFVSPLKLFEYMAAGRPVVSSDLPVLGEVLTDRENALLTEPGSVSSLKTAVEEILTDDSLARRLAANGRSDVTNYTWSRRAETILSFARSL